MDEFTVYPAIDLRGGNVVRLIQGDPLRQTTYGNDPAEVARNWLTCGAKWLHIVNLDGAFGKQDQVNISALKAIMEIVKSTPRANAQFGGGMRSLDDIERAISLGISRVILGTAAIESPKMVETAIQHYGSEKIGLAIDARDNLVQVRGWTRVSHIDPITLGRQYHELGIQTAIYTNINRDGVGKGVDVTATKKIAETTGLSVIASGGVASLEDVKRVHKARLSGVIIGRALYEGSIDLKDALKC